jgi:hypothetical protein
MADTNVTRIKTGKVTFSYANVWEPKAISDGATPKYSVSLIIPKSDTKTLDKIKKAVLAAEKLGKDKGIKLTKASKRPLRDGDEERGDKPEYKDCMFLNASTTMKPQIVDANVDPIMDKTEFYSGCVGRATINFYAFDSNGNKGIAAGLGNLQKLEDGERLAGGATAEDDFGSDDEDDDELM